MTAEEVLEDMRTMGLAVTLVGENLLVTPPGQMTPEIRAVLQANKQALVALLRHNELAVSSAQAVDEPMERPLTPEEKRRIEEAFNGLRDQHGHALVEAGWHRDVVFDGLDPTQCEKVGDVPGVIGLLMSGGRLVQIHPGRLDLEFPDGVPFSKTRGGCLLGGSELEKHLRLHPEIAIADTQTHSGAS